MHIAKVADLSWNADGGECFYCPVRNFLTNMLTHGDVEWGIWSISCRKIYNIITGVTLEVVIISDMFRNSGFIPRCVCSEPLCIHFMTTEMFCHFYLDVWHVLFDSAIEMYLCRETCFMRVAFKVPYLTF